jgi:Flagellar transcriptional activator (FlhC)
VRLGARQRTIAWVTGLPTSFIFHNVFDAVHRAPRGRPPYSEEFIFRSSLRVQAEASAIASKYRLLTTEGFVHSRALITAFKHYLSMVPSPSVSFDEAFFLVSNLDGIWAATKSTLDLGRCRRCGCRHILPRGAASHDGCPFCKVPHSDGDARTAQRHVLPGSAHASDKGDAPAGLSDALEQRIHALRLTRSLEALGAHPRIVATLSGVSEVPERTASAAAHVAPVRFGRPINLMRWGVAISTLQRVQFSLLATVYRRLRAADFGPEEALRAAFSHVSSLFPAGSPLSFDRCFELVALFDARWGVSDAEFDLLGCPKCHSQYLASRRDRAPPHCPFCALARRPQKYL